MKHQQASDAAGEDVEVAAAAQGVCAQDINQLVDNAVPAWTLTETMFNLVYPSALNILHWNNPNALLYAEVTAFASFRLSFQNIVVLEYNNIFIMTEL